MAIYGARDETMRDGPMEENATFIVKPIIRTPDLTKPLYLGDAVAAAPNGAIRLGSRKPELLEWY